MTRYVYPMEVGDEGVYRFLEWIDEEWAYARGKFGGEVGTIWSADDFEEWTRQCVQYIDRAKAYGLDTPAGRQAMCKFAATAIGWVGATHRQFGDLPRGGTTSGEVIGR
jgi:hypothetical protein